MAVQPGLFHGRDRLARLAPAGDSAERLAVVVDFKLFPESAGNGRSSALIGPWAAGGAAIVMLKVLVLQMLNPGSTDDTEYKLRGRLIRMPAASEPKAS